jgi:hypothetical protein
MTHTRRIGDVTIEWEPNEPWAAAFHRDASPSTGALALNAPTSAVRWRTGTGPPPDPIGEPPSFYHGGIAFHRLSDGRWCVDDGSIVVHLPGPRSPDVAVWLRTPEAPPSEPSLQVTLLASLALLLHHRGWFHLHGACVAWEGRTVLLVGASGAGKTTATLDAIRAGFGWYTDDVSFVAAAQRSTPLRVSGWARCFHVTDATLDRDPPLRAALLPGRSLLGKHRLDATHYSPPIDQHATMPLLVFPAFDATVPTTRLEGLRAASAFEHLLHASPWVTLPFLPERMAHEAALLELARRPAWSLRIGADAAHDPSLVPAHLRAALAEVESKAGR